MPPLLASIAVDHGRTHDLARCSDRHRGLLGLAWLGERRCPGLVCSRRLLDPDGPLRGRRRLGRVRRFGPASLAHAIAILRLVHLLGAPGLFSLVRLLGPMRLFELARLLGLARFLRQAAGLGLTCLLGASRLVCLARLLGAERRLTSLFQPAVLELGARDLRFGAGRIGRQKSPVECHRFVPALGER
jgi:hypothetical protein